MAPETTLVVHVESGGATLLRLVRSLDIQTLPASSFDVCFLVDDKDSATTQWLQDLATRRPNVTVLARDAGRDAEAQGVDAASGQWLIFLSQEQVARGIRFHPEALERLSAFATTHECDLVIGRAAVVPPAALNDRLTSDAPRASVSAAMLADAPVVVHAREFALRDGLVAGAKAAARAVAATDRIGVLAAYPAVSLKPATDQIARPQLRIERVDAAWDDGTIRVSVRGSAGPDAAGNRVRFGIRHTTQGVDYWLPGHDVVAADGSVDAATTVDPRTVALGHRLPDGIWQVTVGTHGDSDGESTRIAVPAATLSGGVVDGILVSSSALDGALTLDVGATRYPAIPAFAASDVVVRETARGSLLTAQLTDLAVAGDSRTIGQLLLGDFRLKAELVADPAGARLECYLSGLPGTSDLATRFGRAKPAKTGLSLQMSGVGDMTVFPTPKPDRAQRPAAASSPAPAQPAAGGEGVLKWLRHRVPAPLEPTAKALARNETARRLYRRLSGRRST